MKRSRVALLFACLLAMLSGYAAWCGRTFYLKPQIDAPSAASVPKDVQQAIHRWHAQQDILRPTPFDWREFGWLLCHPYQTGPETVWINLNGGFHNLFHSSIDANEEIHEIYAQEYPDRPPEVVVDRRNPS